MADRRIPILAFPALGCCVGLIGAVLVDSGRPPDLPSEGLAVVLVMTTLGVVTGLLAWGSRRLSYHHEQTRKLQDIRQVSDALQRTEQALQNAKTGSLTIANNKAKGALSDVQTGESRDR